LYPCILLGRFDQFVVESDRCPHHNAPSSQRHLA
jgi:hypothetical protein